MINPRIKVKEVYPNIYCIEELDYKEHCNCYLIVGSEKCLLIDVGVGLIDFAPFLESYVGEKELIVVLTHFHFDHFGGAGQFKEINANIVDIKDKDIGLKYFKKKYFSEGIEVDHLEEKFKIRVEKFKQVQDKRGIDLGDFKFKILFTPGHDPTSISYLSK